jgi:uncharacterized protein YgiM (DUF1202 family)
MKTNCWLILGTMLTTSVVAQVNTNKLPEIPPPAVAAPAAPAPAATPVVAPAETKTNAPAKKAVKAKKKAKKAKAAVKLAEKAEKKAPELSNLPVTLVPGPATVDAENVNLRGQAGLKGEVVGHVKKGDTVTVLSEINLEKPKAGEPAQWAKIALPGGTKVWIDSKFVTNNVVSATKLNLRGGPGENFSVLGIVEKGTTVNSVTTKGDWMQIETPTSAFAFVAAGYLKQEGTAPETNVAAQPTIAATENVPPPAPQMIAPAPTPTPVTEAPTIAPPAANPPPAPEVPAPAPAMTAPTPAIVPTPTLAPDDTDTNLPPPPRIVTHEGTVRHSVSPVAPTYFELYDPANDKAINYLYTSSTNLNLTRYNGLHITVTGEEAMDVRWKDTPVLTIQKINVLASEPQKPKPTSYGKPK